MTDAPSSIQRIEPLLVDAHRAHRAAGISRTDWLAALVSGSLPAPVRVGRRNYYRVADLRAWAAALPTRGGTR